ncbi:hypothetical protein QAD02_023913 [Eretmocerus hayati]|uniref:Uncharacterized protein n=1 Tax=Eretmocerus hayati TaxID=131215 RepID=A0ACC2PX97_9HYME|nr:hypothetical protein QAD02_023913 [Eretmocerus hayati]
MDEKLKQQMKLCREAIKRRTQEDEAEAHDVFNKIQRSLRAGVHPNTVGQYGRTHLHEVALSRIENCGDIVDLLLGAGASPNAVDNDGNTPLILTAEYSLVEKRVMVEKLIAAGADVNKIGWNGRTIRLLLSKEASLSAVNNYGFNALLMATMSGNVELVRHLINVGCDVNYINVKGSDCKPEVPRTALQMAVCNDNADMAKLLIKSGADLDQTDHKGRNILSFAMTSLPYYDPKRKMERLRIRHTEDISNARISTIQALLKQGLDLSRYSPRSPSDFSPLHEAILRNRKGEMLSILLEFDNKVSLNLEHEDQYGLTPLCLAAKDGVIDCLRILVKSGANLEHADRRGCTPLETIVKNFNRSLTCSLRRQRLMNISRNEIPMDPLRNARLALTNESDYDQDELSCIQFLIQAGAKLRNVLSELVPDNSVDELPEIVNAENRQHDRQSLLLRYRLKAAKVIVKYRVLRESKDLSVEDSMLHENMIKSAKLRAYTTKIARPRLPS